MQVTLNFTLSHLTKHKIIFPFFLAPFWSGSHIGADIKSLTPFTKVSKTSINTEVLYQGSQTNTTTTAVTEHANFMSTRGKRLATPNVPINGATKPMHIAIDRGFTKGTKVESKEAGEKYVKGIIEGYNGGAPTNPQVVIKGPNGVFHKRGINSLKIIEDQLIPQDSVQNYPPKIDTSRRSANIQHAFEISDMANVVPNTAIEPTDNTELSPSPTGLSFAIRNDDTCLISGNKYSPEKSPHVDSDFYSNVDDDFCLELRDLFERFNIQEGTLVQRTSTGISIFNRTNSVINHSTRSYDTESSCQEEVRSHTHPEARKIPKFLSRTSRQHDNH